MFAGRLRELEQLDRILFQIKSGNSHHFLIHGERGIGKSSLLFSVQCVARGDFPALDGTTYRFLVVSLELEPTDSYYDIVRKIGGELNRTVRAANQVFHLASAAWEFLKRWEVMGVKYSSDATETKGHELLNELASDIERVVSNTDGAVDGVLFLIDEADKPPATSGLGELTKVLSERLTKRGCERFGLGLAGLSAVVETMRQSHESAPRIFDHFVLEPLLPPERIEVVDKGLDQANAKNSVRTEASGNAKEMIADLSEGYPNFIQEFAYCAFDRDSNNYIDIRDVLSGAVGEGGAFEQLGFKYFQGLYFEQIYSESYRKVLKAMAPAMLDDSEGWVTKQQIREQVNLPETTLSNAIHALKSRNIIVPKTGSRGIYRLPSRAFAVWVTGVERAEKKAG